MFPEVDVPNVGDDQAFRLELMLDPFNSLLLGIYHYNKLLSFIHDDGVVDCHLVLRQAIRVPVSDGESVAEKLLKNEIFVAGNFLVEQSFLPFFQEH